MSEIVFFQTPQSFYFTLLSLAINAFAGVFQAVLFVFILELWSFLLFGYSMDVDFSPTGREFVTGSYDRTVGELY
jgi:hypothetical protein